MKVEQGLRLHFKNKKEITKIVEPKSAWTSRKQTVI